MGQVKLSELPALATATGAITIPVTDTGDNNATKSVTAQQVADLAELDTIEVGEYRQQGAVSVQADGLGTYGAFFNPSNDSSVPVLFLTAQSGHYNGGPATLTVDGVSYDIPAANINLPNSGIVDDLTYASTGNPYADSIIQVRDFYALTNTDEAYWIALADATTLGLGGNDNVNYGYNTSTFNAGALHYIENTTVTSNLIVNGNIVNDDLTSKLSSSGTWTATVDEDWNGNAEGDIVILQQTSEWSRVGNAVTCSFIIRADSTASGASPQFAINADSLPFSIAAIGGLRWIRVEATQLRSDDADFNAGQSVNYNRVAFARTGTSLDSVVLSLGVSSTRPHTDYFGVLTYETEA